MLKNMAEMLKKGKLYPDKRLWRVMADSAQVIDGHYDMAVAFLEGGSTYYIHDHIRANRKVTFLHNRQITARQIQTGEVSMLAGGVRIQGADLQEIAKIRTWQELLFPLHGKVEREYTAEQKVYGWILR